MHHKDQTRQIIRIELLWSIKASHRSKSRWQGRGILNERVHPAHPTLLSSSHLSRLSATSALNLIQINNSDSRPTPSRPATIQIMLRKGWSQRWMSQFCNHQSMSSLHASKSTNHRPKRSKTMPRTKSIALILRTPHPTVSYTQTDRARSWMRARSSLKKFKITSILTN